MIMDWLVSRCLDLGYLGLVLAASPWIFWNSWFHGKHREGFREKVLGDLRPPVDQADSGNDLMSESASDLIWVHAVSVGEVLSLKQVLIELLKQQPTARVVLTVTTQTGHAVARRIVDQMAEPRLGVRYFPLDFSWSVTRAIRQLQPSLIVLAELEVWPNLLLAARKHGVPVVIANGRLSQRSFKGYWRGVWFFRWLLRDVAAVGAQTPEYAERFVKLGVPAERVRVTGNIKYDRIETNRNNPRTEALRAFFGFRENDLVWIAGSTQSPEESLAIEAWKTLRLEFPNLQLMVVPRHQERFEEVSQLIQSLGCQVWRRSTWRATGAADTSRPTVRLLDTLGELGDAWGLADLAFVGGSLTQRGGQNMIEPAGYGAAVFFGPHTQNFRQTVETLLEADAARVVSRGQELPGFVRLLLRDENLRCSLGSRAQQLVLRQAGATEATLALAQMCRSSAKSGNPGALLSGDVGSRAA
ncbi:MAG: 3-deoxy-D-manno-octulosonic acid transferase [Planctomyces sp.]|nr:3-deoxy-D-manno-octulosonic acid transferase [Planctomyces sp.]